MLNFISTPIGNLNDISLRAIDVIRSSDYLYTEDTRRSKILLDHINLQKKCNSFHEHNEDSVSKKIIQQLSDNKIISIISDAGTPGISDPGYKLIKKCIIENLKYTLIPGPSSVISALLMSGLPTDKFSFFGFFPKKNYERELLLQNFKCEKKTIIFFESPKRISKTLDDISSYLDSKRMIAICKEMTKVHENVLRGNILEVSKIVKENKFNLKGEIVVVIEGEKSNKKEIEIDNRIKNEYLKKLSASDSAKLISLITGARKRDIYKKLIQN
tara:strand:- start:94 stop:909 length:816 start_codon:yes stop_codon:yes gene_type:complete